jgi:hypothetical protein
MDAASRSRYHEIKSVFASIIKERQAEILGGANADDTVSCLRQHGYAWISSVVVPRERGHYEWNGAFVEALRQRIVCEQMLAAGVSVDDVITLLRGQGYCLAEVAAFVEGLAGLASGRARKIVASQFEHSSAQA